MHICCWRIYKFFIAFFKYTHKEKYFKRHLLHLRTNVFLIVWTKCMYDDSFLEKIPVSIWISRYARCIFKLLLQHWANLLSLINSDHFGFDELRVVTTKILSSVMSCYIVRSKSADVSEKYVASIFRVQVWAKKIASKKKAASIKFAFC